MYSALTYIQDMVNKACGMDVIQQYIRSCLKKNKKQKCTDSQMALSPWSILLFEYLSYNLINVHFYGLEWAPRKRSSSLL